LAFLKIVLWIFCIVAVLIILAVLLVLLLLSIRVGIKLDYDDAGTALKIKYGLIGFKVLPKKEKKPKKQKSSVSAAAKDIAEPQAYKLKDKLVAKSKQKMELGEIQKEIQTAEYLASEPERLAEEEARLNAEMEKAEQEVRKLEIAEAIGNPYPDVVDESQVSTLASIKDKLDTMDLEGAYNLICSYASGFSFDSITALLSFLGSQTTGTLKKVGRRFLIKQFSVGLTVTGADAAQTAVKYGQVAAVAFPALEKLVTNARVRKYDLDIQPDFIAKKNSAEFHNYISFSPLRVLTPFLAYFAKVGLKTFKFVDKGATIADKELKRRQEETHAKLIEQTADQLAMSGQE